jgi:hypothetical protein
MNPADEKQAAAISSNVASYFCLPPIILDLQNHPVGFRCALPENKTVFSN